ncbi:GTP cyclohydrolase I [Sphaerochaeta sp. PS]|uniref:GTP cyclohydrolase I n=1 Tax=Sphaerochaeta sp. PS TaxID=3076336 RepID=UPI0028A5591C|nr:GTP cyclohydrolase I [Sphaerochaeta sp. PS]MDT4761780.1 GTP cyclohydrolase I [Sphaerochaeta sp. PS]
MHSHDDNTIDSEYLAAMKLQKRSVSAEQFSQFEGYVAEIFTAFGLDLHSPSTEETPRRFIKALYDITEGYDGDPKLVKAFETECHGDSDCRLSQIIQGPIPFYALCEHHALPFYGKVYVGYIANENIIGISKLTRLVRLFSKRFAVQERIGQEIAGLLDVMVHPTGVAVYIEAHHLCMEMRGVREEVPMTRTTVWRGAYHDDPALRSEFFTSCGLPRNG